MREGLREGGGCAVRSEEGRAGPKQVDQLQCAGELSVRHKTTRAYHGGHLM